MSISGVSKDASDWLVQALDPFHDFQRSIEGMPDEEVGNSFVRMHVQYGVYSATAEGDRFRISFSGFHAPEAMELCTMTDFQTAAPVGTIYNLYPINVLRSSSASNPCMPALVAGTATNLGGFATIPGVADIPSRLCAIGIEITDVTQELYKQGTISVGRSTGDFNKGEFWGYENGGAVDVHTSAATGPMIPISQSALAAHPSFIEWEAKKGCYTVGRLIKPQPPAYFYQSAGTAHVCHPICYQETSTTTVSQYITMHNNTASAFDAGTARGAAPSGFEPFTIFISGVDVNAQFRVVVRTLVEYFPTYLNGATLAGATMSPIYEPNAFRVYHDAARRLPSGVPVDMNGKGDYWRMVLKALRAGTQVVLGVAPTALTLAGRPDLALLAKAIAVSTAPLLKKRVEPNKPKQKPRNK